MWSRKPTKLRTARPPSFCSGAELEARVRRLRVGATVGSQSCCRVLAGLWGGRRGLSDTRPAFRTLGTVLRVRPSGLAGEGR